jgi:hypothetical protein
VAGLPWIEIETDLPTHPKSVRLALKLGDNRAWTYMVQLWLWCAEQVPTGRIDGEDAIALIAFGAGWTGDASRFVTAGIESGFIDRDGESFVMHGLAERLAAHIAKRAKDKARQQKRRARLAKKFGAPPVTRDVRVTGEGRPAESRRNSNKNTNSNDQQQVLGDAARPDPRHTPVKEMMTRVYAELREGADMPWGPAQGSQLKNLLKTIPNATVEEFERRWRHSLRLGRHPGTADPLVFFKRWAELVPLEVAANAPGVRRAVGSVGDFTKKEANEF